MRCGLSSRVHREPIMSGSQVLRSAHKTHTACTTLPQGKVWATRITSEALEVTW